MNKPFSLYLDLFRLFAALTVVVFHANLPRMGGPAFKFPFGLDAVMAFFVLSGFVIGYVSDQKEKTFYEFSIARLSRLYSVLLPALILTPVIDLVGKHFATWPYAEDQFIAFEHPALRLLTASVFLNEAWFTSTAVLSNGPVWSIAFEFWYYAIFAAAFFLRGTKRLVVTFLAILIAGPKILLLFPAWLMGYFLYKKSNSINLPTRISWSLFFIGPIFIILGHIIHLDDKLLTLTEKIFGQDFTLYKLKYAKNFLWYNLIAIAWIIHLMGAISISKMLKSVPSAVERAIRVCAAATFPIYLLHHPIQMAVAAMIKTPHNSLERVFFEAVISVAISSLMTPVTTFIMRHMRRYGLKQFRSKHLQPVINQADSHNTYL